MSRRTILITGCSSGIGRTTAKYFRGKGWNVIATVRSNRETDTELNALNNVPGLNQRIGISDSMVSITKNEGEYNS
jgi:NAD(P)-dependent dehydrogenase (short-subunit alcohol dehydrogenase family)